MKSRQGVIYYLRCTATDKGYVGQSVNHERRWQVHINTALRTCSDTPLCRAIRKYGVEQFTAEVVRRCRAQDLNRLETYYIKKLRTFIDDPKGGGYNLTMGGDYAHPSQDVIARRTVSLKAAYQKDPTLRNRTGGAHKGKKVSAETKSKISAAHKNVPLSEFHVETLRQSWASGKRKPANSGEKISKALKRRYATDMELRKRLSDSHKGMQFSEEHRRKLSEKRSAVLAAQTPEQRRERALLMVAARKARALAA